MKILKQKGVISLYARMEGYFSFSL